MSSSRPRDHHDDDDVHHLFMLSLNVGSLYRPAENIMLLDNSSTGPLA